MARRTGSFDDDTFAGLGTRGFEDADPALARQLGTENFEFRLVGETFWFLNPLSEPPSWAGYDFTEFSELAGVDPLGSMDADSILGVILLSTIEVESVQPRDDGEVEWRLRVRADDLLPIVSAGGPAARLAEAGAGNTGLEASLLLLASEDGYVTGVSADLEEWWSNAVALAFPGETENYAMILDIQFEEFDTPLEVESPCVQPTEETDDTGLAVLSCEA